MPGSFSFENGHLIVHPCRPEDLDRFTDLVSDVFSIFSNLTLEKFLPSKRIFSKEEAEILLQNKIISHHSHRSYLHFITDQNQNKVIGLIDLISPIMAEDFYQLDFYPYFIEFYLSPEASGLKVMSTILPIYTNELKKEDVLNVGAVVNKQNLAAQKVLERSNFSRHSDFDRWQDLYLFNVTKSLRFDPKENIELNK